MTAHKHVVIVFTAVRPGPSLNSREIISLEHNESHVTFQVDLRFKETGGGRE